MRRALLLLVACCGGQTAISVAPPPPSASSSAKISTAPPPPRPGSNVRVHIEGAKEVSEAELASVVDIDKPGKSAGASNRDVLERDTLLVHVKLYDLGYLQSRVEEPRVAIGSDGVIDVTFPIEEGVRFRLTKLDVEEKDERTGKLVTPLLQATHAKVGTWFSRKTLVDDVQAIQTTYRDAGYGTADAVPEMDLDAQARTVEARIVIHRGPIVTYRNVQIDPPDALVASDAATRIGVTAGARYSETKLTQVKAELLAKGMRADVVTKEVRGRPDTVDVTIEVH